MATTRKLYSREYKFEAVRLVTERGVSVAQAARDLGVTSHRVVEIGAGRRCNRVRPRAV